MHTLALLFSAFTAGMPATYQAPPQAPPPAQEVEIRFKTGKVLDATVLSVTDQNVVVELTSMDDAQATFSLNMLTPQSVCSAERAVLKDNDLAGWRKLADFAKQNNLHAEYVAALDMVARIDPKQNIEKELATARGALAQNRLDRGKKFLDNGQLNQAMDTLSAVALYKGTPAAAEAEKLLQVVNQDMAKAQQQAAAALDSRAKVRAADQKFQSIGALVDRAQTALQQGAGMTDNKVNMQTEYQTAIALLNRASDELQSLHNSLNTGFSNSQDKGLAPVMQEGEKMHLTIEGGLMQAYIELGYLYVSMTRVYDATRCANAAANIDPNDPRIASLRQAIEFPGGTGGVSGGPWRRWPGWGAVPAGARR